VVCDICSADFTITEQPAASAGPIFHAIIISGKFHGRIAAATPMVSREKIDSASSPEEPVLSYVLSIALACHLLQWISYGI
jgi:hypothetical protein